MRPSEIRPKYDGTTRSGLDAQDERAALYARCRGYCQAPGCGKRVEFSAFDVAHCIANTKVNRRKYGSAVIDHPLNKRVTHPGRCNDAVNCGHNPASCAAIIQAIALDDDALVGV